MASDEEAVPLSNDDDIGGLEGTPIPLWHKCFFFGSLLLIFVLVLAGVIYSVASPAHDASNVVQVSVLAEQYWNYTLSQNPELATFTGYPGYDSILSNITILDFESQIAAYYQMQTKLKTLPEPTDPDEYVNYKMLSETIRYTLLKLNWALDRIPINQLSGPQIDLLQLFEMAPFVTDSDRDDYLKRLKAIPVYMQNVQKFIADLQINNITLAKLIAQKLPLQFQAVLNAINDNSSGFYRTCFINSHFTQCPGIINAVQTDVKSAFEQMKDYINNTYIPLCRDSIGISDLPNGTAYYNVLAEIFTTTTLTPTQIHNIGLQEVARINASMQVIAAKNNKSFEDFLAYLRNDTQFYPKDEDDYLTFIRNVCKMADGGLPALFGQLPRCPYAVIPMPAHQAPAAPGAMYFQPDAKCTRPGIYYVNTYNVKHRPFYTMQSTSLHEAVPGHHLQLAIQQEASIAPYRQFGDWTAFIEGWALYSESLGSLMGFYNDPDSIFLFGRYSDEIFRACRLVVDTGIHQQGWTRQRAIDYMASLTAMNIDDITTEVDRYIAWPGQALAYKIGELKIQEIKQTISSALNDKFDIRQFHDYVLGQGALPLDLLENYIYDIYCRQFSLTNDFCKI